MPPAARRKRPNFASRRNAEHAATLERRRWRERRQHCAMPRTREGVEDVRMLPENFHLRLMAGDLRRIEDGHISRTANLAIGNPRMTILVVHATTTGARPVVPTAL